LIKKASGIPDFRSPSSGLYTKLCGFDLPYPEAIFELSYFQKHPEPFFALAKELYPKTYKPTPVNNYNSFIKSLHTIQSQPCIYVF
jgi:NAD-dependent deacetylase sirtuin 2